MLKKVYINTNFVKSIVNSDFIFINSSKKKNYNKILNSFHLNSDLKNFIRTILFLKQNFLSKKKAILIIVDDIFLLDFINLIFYKFESKFLIQVELASSLITIPKESCILTIFLNNHFNSNKFLHNLFYYKKILINQINFDLQLNQVNILGFYSVNNLLNKNSLKKILFLSLLIKNLISKQD